MEVLQSLENVGRELSLYLVAIVALIQGPKNTAPFEGERSKARNRRASIEGEAERSCSEGHDGRNPRVREAGRVH